MIFYHNNGEVTNTNFLFLFKLKFKKKLFFFFWLLYQNQAGHIVYIIQKVYDLLNTVYIARYLYFFCFALDAGSLSTMSIIKLAM